MAKYAKFFSVGGGGGGTNNLQLPIGTVLDATLRQVQDGTGTGSPLYLSINRVGITSDPSVTIEPCSVIAASTTNANLVIAPNGTGALVASIPDGTATGGNARGANAVDLQTSRTLNTQIAGRDYSVIAGGQNNLVGGVASAKWSGILAGRGNSVLGNFDGIISGDANTTNLSGSYNVIGGGLSNAVSGSAAYSGVFSGASNTASANYSVVSGGLTNTASSTWCTVSGGQSNTASTNTHATVVGGQTNTSSGQNSVSGGNGNTSSSSSSVAFGYLSQATNQNAFAAGAVSKAQGNSSVAIGNSNTSSGGGSVSFGEGNISENTATVAIGSFNRASAVYSSAFGYQSRSWNYGTQALSSGQFTIQGDAQQSLLTARRVATLTTGGTTVLSLDGTGVTELIIPNGSNRMWKVKVEYVGTITTITGTATGLTVGDSVYGEENFGFKRLAATSTMGPIMNETQSSDNAIMDTCALVVTAGASQEMALTFTGPTFAGGGSVTMRVVAKVALVEVAF